MSRANEIYNLDRQLEKRIESLRNDLNKKTILRYQEARVADGISKARQLKCINILKSISEMLGKKFEKATKKDMITLIAKIEQKPLSDWTKRDFKKILKKFYQWLYGLEPGEYPEVVRWIRAGYKLQNSLKRSDLLTADEIKRLAESSKTLRDRALTLVLAESGRRIGEILTIRIGDVEFDNMGARLLVDGKMGKDYVRIMSSSPILATWLDNHPKRDDPKSPVWATFDKHGVRQLTYPAASAVLRDCAKRAGITKRVWFTLYRHTRGTDASTKLNTQQLCALMGWKQGSKMPSVYVHLAGEDIDEAQAIMNGVRVEKQNESKLQLKVCERCEYKNSSLSKFCNKCGLCLDLKTSLEVDKKRNKIDSLFDKLAKEPEKLEKILKLIE